MEGLIPQQPWKELNDGLDGMVADVDQLAGVENHDVDALQVVLGVIQGKVKAVVKQFFSLSKVNECFCFFAGHDVGGAFHSIGLEVEFLIKKYSNSVQKQVREYFGKSSRIEQLDEAFYEKLYLLALDFCRKKAASPKKVTKDLKEMLQRIEALNANFFVRGSLRDLEDRVIGLVGDLAELHTISDERLLEVIRDELGKAGPSQAFYDDLYVEAEEFCLGDAPEKEDIPAGLKEKVETVGGEDSDFIYFKKEIDKMRTIISDEIAIICNSFWQANMAVKSMGHWVEGETLTAGKVDVNGFFQRVGPILQPMLEPGIVNFEIESGLVAEMHEGTVGNLLFNMCKNAQRHGSATNLVVKVYRDGEIIKIEVIDDGCGIEEAVAGRIFEKGFSTRREGQGLGLALADERMRAMGGNIEVVGHGGMGGGAVFVMSLRQVAA